MKRFFLLVIFLLGIVQTAPSPLVARPMLQTGLAQQANGIPLEAVRDYTGMTTWHTAGYTGEGVRVGIIDRGFAGISQVTTDVTFPDTADRNLIENAYTDHGTLIYQVLADGAPNAEYFLFQLSPNGKNITDAVDWLLGQEVDVVVYAVTVLEVPFNGDNHQSREMSRLALNDVVVVVAAGNYGLSYATDTYVDNDGDGWHEFQWGYESMWAAPIFTSQFGESHLRWQDIYTSAQIDLDLYVIDSDGQTVLEAATTVQQGGAADWPYEDVFYPTTSGVPIYIGVRAKIPGTIPDGTIFHLYVEETTLGDPDLLGSITAPGDSPNVLTVGAIEANEALWQRSSRGPTWDGRIKPDLVAPTRLQLTPEIIFLGTSASTPLVGASAALVRQAYPEWTERQVREFLLLNARDLGDSGADNLFGYGRLWLPPPQ